VLPKGHRLGATKARVVESVATRCHEEPTVWVHLDEPDPDIGEPTDRVKRHKSCVAEDDEPPNPMGRPGEASFAMERSNAVAHDESTAFDPDLHPIAVDDAVAGSRDG
jgi:hypothetical protein